MSWPGGATRWFEARPQELCDEAAFRRIVAGSSANSFVCQRISGAAYGPQMPPTGALRPEQIALVKAWIDQGANWPDSLANERDLPPVNPKAVSMVDSLRTGDLATFMKSASADPALLNARGPEGSTPFMYAVLYSDASTLTQLMKLGADPTRRIGGAPIVKFSARSQGEPEPEWKARHRFVPPA